MSGIAISATIAAFLALAIPAILSMILSEVTRAHVRRQSRHITGNPPPPLTEHIDTHLRSSSSISNPRPYHQINIALIYVPTNTFLQRPDFLEATHDSSSCHRQNDVRSSGEITYSRYGQNHTGKCYLSPVLVDIGPSIHVAAAYVFTCDLGGNTAAASELGPSRDELSVVDVPANVICAGQEDDDVEGNIINDHSNIPRTQHASSPSFQMTSTLPMIVEEDELSEEEIPYMTEPSYLSLRSSPFTLFGLASIVEESEEESTSVGDKKPGLVNLLTSSQYYITNMTYDASDLTRYGRPSTDMSDVIALHNPDTLDAVNLDFSVDVEQIDSSNSSLHWTSSVSSPGSHCAMSQNDIDEKTDAEDIKTSPSSLSVSDMNDEEALAWAYSFMLRFNAAAASLAATPGYDLEEESDYEDECRHPVSPILESIDEEDEDLSDDDLFRDDGDLSSSSISLCGSATDEQSWNYGYLSAQMAATPRSVHQRINFPEDPYTPPYVRPNSRLSFNSPAA